MPARSWSLLLVVTLLSLTVGAIAQDDAPPPAGPAETPSVEPAPEPSPQPTEDGGAADGEQTDGPDEGEGGDGPQQPPADGPGIGDLFSNPMMLVLFAVLILMIVFSSRSRKKQQKKREAMLGGLKKGDKVVTIGGIVGTIIEVKDSEIVVKVDEQSNARMRFAKWSIRAAGQDVKDETGQADQEQK